MKRFTPIITFFAGCGFMLLISAKNQTNPVEEIPRQHLVALGQVSYIYDAVTGEYKEVTYAELKRHTNFKDVSKK